MIDPPGVFDLNDGPPDPEALLMQHVLYGNVYYRLPARLVLVKPCAYPYAHGLHDWHTLPGRRGKMYRCIGSQTAPAGPRHAAPQPRWVRTFTLLAATAVITAAAVVRGVLW